MMTDERLDEIEAILDEDPGWAVVEELIAEVRRLKKLWAPQTPPEDHGAACKHGPCCN